MVRPSPVRPARPEGWQEIEQHFGVRAEDAVLAAEFPDRTKRLVYRNICAQVHLKWMGEGSDTRYALVVIERISELGKRALTFAIRYPSPVRDGSSGSARLAMESLSGVAALKILTRRFGCPVEVGDHRERFIWTGEVPVPKQPRSRPPDPNELLIVTGGLHGNEPQDPVRARFTIEIPGECHGHDIFTHYLGHTNREFGMLYFALVFALDVDAYRAWARKRGLP